MANVPNSQRYWFIINGSTQLKTPGEVKKMIDDAIEHGRPKPKVELYTVSGYAADDFTVGTEEGDPGEPVSDTVITVSEPHSGSDTDYISNTCTYDSKLFDFPHRAEQLRLLRHDPAEIENIVGKKNCITGKNASPIRRRAKNYDYGSEQCYPIPVSSVIAENFIPIFLR